MAFISHLFQKSTPGQPVIAQNQLQITDLGPDGGPKQHPWKQLLLLPQQVLQQFDIVPGQLKEDVVIDDDIDLHALPSGTCLQLGEVVVRLTFHCEPCGKIKSVIAPKKLLHLRGYHSQVIQPGLMQCQDKVDILEARYPDIPYGLADRIQWYLAQNPEPILVRDLMDAIGFSASYCRAVPNSIRHRDDIDPSLILYQNRR